MLIEALPYIQSFKDKVVLVKLGGSMLSEEEEQLNSTLKDVVFMHSVGIKPVVVHGGGGRITENMRKAGLESRFVAGYRVTDAEAMEIVEETLVREVNVELVDKIKELGAQAEGCSGKDEGMLQVERFRPLVSEKPGEEAKPVDIGFVGRVTAVNAEPVNRILQRGSLPVVATLGLGVDGLVHNVNGDEAASKIAEGLRTEKLVFLTNVRGLLRDPNDEGSLMSSLDAAIVEKLLEEKVIAGGMIPKVTAGLEAVRNGVHKTHIIDGRLPHSLLLEIFTDKGIGTQIVL